MNWIQQIEKLQQSRKSRLYHIGKHRPAPTTEEALKEMIDIVIDNKQSDEDLIKDLINKI